MDSQPQLGLHRDARGLHGLSRTEDGGRIRVMVPDPRDGEPGEPTLADLSQAITAVYGTDFGLRAATWISAFTDAARQAQSYRDRRVLLAGDAAHVHSPTGGQGLNTGVQDAVNLGWKLAQVVAGTSPDSLLDSYQAERHPVGARVLRTVMAQTALLRTDPRTDALRETMSGLLGMNEPRQALAAAACGLDIRYDLGAGHPAVGRRLPDLDLVTTAGPRRAYTLLHEARPVLLNLGAPGSLGIAPWTDRVRLVDARAAGPWELPVIGEVSAPAAVLVRPDGHVAWAGEAASPALADALATWFGPPAAP